MLHQVGAGTLGPVFRAYDSERDRLVAVKLFRLDLPPERAHQLVAEFEQLIASQLAHPAIVAPLAAGLAGTQAYLALEFVAADSLDVVIRDYGPAPAGDAVRVATILAGALDFAAVVNVAHGALHPRDVLISQDDTHVTGIGVARALERVGIVPPVRRPYTAPERVAGGAWDRRADIFSLAALVYELMYGRRISGAGREAIDGVTELPGANLPALRDAFARALAADPAERFDTALAFAEAMTAACPKGQAAAAAPKKKPQPEPLLPLEDAEPAPQEPEVALPDDLELRQAETARFDEIGTTAVMAPSLDDDVASASAPTAPTPIVLEPQAAAPPAPEQAAPVEADVLHAVSPSRDEERPGIVAPGARIAHERTGFWTIVLALVLGIALGFGGGYAVGLRQRPLSMAADAPVQPAPIAAPGSASPAPSAANAAPEPARPSTSSGRAASAGHAEDTARPERVEGRGTRGVAPSESGRLLIRTTPAGARVLVDGLERGRTPIALRDLPPGTHRVRVEHEGYTPVERRAVITARQPAVTMTVALTRLRPAVVPTPSPAATRAAESDRFVGEVAIDSRPSGARVYVDGRLVGTTPMLIPGVQAGEHVIRLELGSYRRWSSLVRVQAGERNRVTASLEK